METRWRSGPRQKSSAVRESGSLGLHPPSGAPNPSPPISRAGYLVEGRLLRTNELGLELEAEEYLGGVLDFTGELNRFAVTRATVRDVAAVQKAADLVDGLMGMFLMFDFRNGNLRKKYDRYGVCEGLAARPGPARPPAATVRSLSSQPQVRPEEPGQHAVRAEPHTEWFPT